MPKQKRVNSTLTAERGSAALVRVLARIEYASQCHLEVLLKECDDDDTDDDDDDNKKVLSGC